MEQRWYVVNTKWASEGLAAQQLRNQNFDVFFPEYQEKFMKNRLRFVRTKALYPTYIFVMFDVDKDPWFKIKNTKGVKEILGATADRATPIRKGFVEAMLQAAETTGTLVFKEENEGYRFKVGERVTINAINFKGLEGVVSEIKKDKIIIKTYLLSRQISLSLGSNLISPLKSESCGVAVVAA